MIAVHVVQATKQPLVFRKRDRDGDFAITGKFMLKNGTTILTPELEKQQDGKVATHVTDKIVNTNDKDHEITAEYQIVRRGGERRSQTSIRTASQKDKKPRKPCHSGKLRSRKTGIVDCV